MAQKRKKHTKTLWNKETIKFFRAFASELNNTFIHRWIFQRIILRNSPTWRSIKRKAGRTIDRNGRDRANRCFVKEVFSAVFGFPWYFPIANVKSSREPTYSVCWFEQTHIWILVLGQTPLRKSCKHTENELYTEPDGARRTYSREICHLC